MTLGNRTVTQSSLIEGGGLHLRARKDMIKDAPHFEDDGHLSEQEVMELHRHYGLDSGTTPQGTAPQGTTPRGSDPQGRDSAGGPGTAAGAKPEQSVLRSEERLRAGTETVESGRVRLRKYVVTEEQQITVPVKHEEVHVTREPLSAEDARAAGGKAGIGDEEVEVILHEERPVVAKETVLVERIGLSTETVQEERQVRDTVRKEQVEIDDSGKPRR
jgi:uncharacterized protein (TIGR02271 family)